jgi:SulP family sulfate permease
LDYKGIGHLTRVPRADAVIMIIVLLVTVFLDLITAVAIGMVLASLLFMKKMSQITEENIRITGLKKYRDEIDWHDEYLPAHMQDNVIVKHLDGPMFFGFAAKFQERINKLPDIKYIIIRMEKVPFIDQTGLYALEEAILSLEQRNINVILTGFKKQPYDMLRKVRIIPNLISEDNIYADFKDAVRWLARNKIEELT